MQLRGKYLILIAAALQFAHHETWWPNSVPATTERRIYAVAIVVIAGGFSWLNRSLLIRNLGRVALISVPAGTTLNAIPMLFLGGMPFSASAALTAGLPRAEVYADLSGYVRLDQTSAWWAPVADVIPVPVINKVLSVGDVVLFAGLIVLLLALAGEVAPSSARSATQLSPDNLDAKPL